MTSQSDENRVSLETLATRPAVVTIDLHRGHLDPTVATLPLPADLAAAVVERASAQLERFRSLGVPIIHVVTAYRNADEILSNRYWRRQATRGDGARGRIASHNHVGTPGLELMPGIAGAGDAVVTTKKRYDCFVGTDLAQVLEAGRHDSVLIMGVNTNSCVIATAIAASVRDYAVFVLADAVDTMMGTDLHEAALAVIDASFGWVTTSDDVIDVLRLRRPGADVS